MPDVNIVAFETAVEKHCADWVLEVAKSLARTKTSVTEHTRTLRKHLAAIPFPKDSPEREQAKLPDRINQILKEQSVRLKGIVDAEITSKVKDKKLVVDGHSLAGIITSL